MQELEFVELDEAGRLVVQARDGTRYAVPVDDRLRVALRPRRQAPTAEGQVPASTPREVQSMIRAGQSAEEVAAATGWELERVRRFEGPVLAEREHVVGVAQAAPVRARGRTDGTQTLERRVRERLQDRGVPPTDVSWDAYRSSHQRPWTVIVAFSAGGRERRAAWHYDVAGRSIEALDDEARWLSEDEQALPGGLAGHPLLGSSHSEDETADLMATMRQRRQARGRRTPRPVREGRDPAPGREADDELPLTEDLPPAAHPRGSAPESPSPVSPPGDQSQSDDAPVGGDDPTPLPTPHPVTGEEASPSTEKERGPGTTSEGVTTQDSATQGAKTQGTTSQGPATSPSDKAARRRERRRLRMPKLPPVVGDPPPETEDEGPELAYARTYDPLEVSFDEFFGLEDDPEEAGQDGPVKASEPGGPERDAPKDEAADAAPGKGATPARKKGRTSVPSWDDIMFGGGGGDRRQR